MNSPPVLCRNEIQPAFEPVEAPPKHCAVNMTAGATGAMTSNQYTTANRDISGIELINRSARGGTTRKASRRTNNRRGRYRSPNQPEQIVAATLVRPRRLKLPDASAKSCSVAYGMKSVPITLPVRKQATLVQATCNCRSDWISAAGAMPIAAPTSALSLASRMP